MSWRAKIASLSRVALGVSLVLSALLTATALRSPDHHWLARLLAYVCTAFLVACANASLVTTLSIARLTFPACPSLATSPNAVGRLASQVVLAIQSWTLRQAYPRAPPIPVAAVSQFMAPDAHALLCHDCKFSKGARVCPSSF